MKRKRTWIYSSMALFAATALMVTGCGNGNEAGASADGLETGAESQGEAAEGLEEGMETAETAAEAQSEEAKGLANETAADGHIDFEALQKENPDIFAWLYVPGTEIDDPILQSPVSDDYYKSHTADGAEGAAGALYTEMPNMMNMCDFNTIIHGKDEEKTDLFSDLHKFEDPDFFGEHEVFYIYLPDNVLTYEIFTAYYDEGSDILRRYDYTTYAGCQSYLKQVYDLRDMSKNLREGWDDLTPYHFLVTLDGSIRENGEKQYTVTGVLIGDAAGRIDRVILD